ncbi:MAG: integrase family protein [Pseudomonadota bacterium]
MTKLTDRYVRDLGPPEKGNRVVFESWASPDAVKGFGVRITAKGALAFVLRYIFDGREYRYTIGSFPSWSVLAARNQAKRLRAQIDMGETHPMAERAAKREELRARRQAETFGEAVEDYIQREQIGRRQNSTAHQVRRGLLTDCAAWLDLPVAEITAKDVRKRLEELRDGTKDEAARPYLANRTYAYLATFFRWCAEPGIELVPMSPMLGMRKPWEGEETRQRWFTNDELAKLWRAADSLGGVPGAYLKIALLTGKRRSALAAMQWEHVDEDCVWTPPTDGRKRKRNKRLHGVPLPKLAQRVLSSIRPAGTTEGNVFPGKIRGSRLHPGTTLQRRIRTASGIEDFFMHACRHTVETRLAELGIQPHIRDLLLDHAPARGAGAGYDHYTYRDEMRAALEVWAGHIEALVAADGVTVLR